MEPILGGKTLGGEKAWRHMFQDFWSSFKAARGDGHEGFKDHPTQLDCCCPVMVHGDEGRGKLRRAVMAMSLQPMIVAKGHGGHSFNSRFLHSILPGELYEGDMSLQILQDAVIADLQELYTHGIKVAALHWF